MKGPLARIRRRKAFGTAPEPEQPTTAMDPAAAPTMAQPPAPAPSLFGAPSTIEQPAAPAVAAPGPVPDGATGPAAEAARLPADTTPEELRRPSFRDRGRLRRRLRYLRRVRELGFRDLGGLVFDLDRFGRQGDHLVRGKLAALRAVDDELRALERALDERRDVLELREPGIAACPRCGSLHGSDARFCPNCGVGLRGPRAVAEVAHVEHPGEAPVPLPPPAGAAPPPPPPPPPPAAPEPAPPAQQQQPEPPPPAAEQPPQQEPGELSWSEAAPPAPPQTPPGGEGSLSWPGEDQPTEVLRPSDRPDAAERHQ